MPSSIVIVTSPGYDLGGCKPRPYIDDERRGGIHPHPPSKNILPSVEKTVCPMAFADRRACREGLAALWHGMRAAGAEAASAGGIDKAGRFTLYRWHSVLMSRGFFRGG